MTSKKRDSILDFSIILSRGYVNNAACKIFSGIKHDQLITDFMDYVNSNKDKIGLNDIQNRQSIADNGCDVYVELRGGVKIGVQIKSEFDVLQDNFTSKVKSQYSESLALGLDKYYILICSPVIKGTANKIGYITSWLATLKTTYHAVLTPKSAGIKFYPISF